MFVLVGAVAPARAETHPLYQVHVLKPLASFPATSTVGALPKILGDTTNSGFSCSMHFSAANLNNLCDSSSVGTFPTKSSTAMSFCSSADFAQLGELANGFCETENESDGSGGNCSSFSDSEERKMKEVNCEKQATFTQVIPSKLQLGDHVNISLGDGRKLVLIVKSVSPTVEFQIASGSKGFAGLRTGQRVYANESGLLRNLSLSVSYFWSLSSRDYNPGQAVPAWFSIFGRQAELRSNRVALRNSDAYTWLFSLGIDSRSTFLACEYETPAGFSCAGSSATLSYSR